MTTIVARKAKLLKHHLITMGLERRQRIGLLGQDESGLGGVAFLRRLLVEELSVPNLLLRLPVDDEPLLDRSSKLYLAKVLALIQLGADECFPVAVAGDAIWNDAGLVGLAFGNESSLDRVCAIVEYQCL